MGTRTEPMQLGSIELFCKAADLGSFTGAAQALGLTPAAVSRSIARLEQRLGARLFARTTRQVRLTDEGRLYHEQCRQALAQLEAAALAVGGRRAVPQGLLRISLPTTYAHYRVLPVLSRFTQRYRQVQVDLHITNRNVDLVEEGFDLAIRQGEPQDSRLVARKLEDATLGVFASPAYLKRRGRPKTLDDLAGHDCIQFVLPSTGRTLPYVFRDGGEDAERELRGAVRVQEDVLGCVGLAVAGGGLCQTYHYIARGAVQRGELVEVLKPYAGRSRPFSILYPHNRHLAARVRAFVDFISAQVNPKA
jgi:DNA-binding transcriptional LysR family regulator